MNKTLVIWDQLKFPEVASQEVFLWQSYNCRGAYLSIPDYLEKHAERFRKKYLKFIHELGESKINGKRITDHLDLGDGFSLWWMTLLAEKSPYKSPAIYDCLRLMVLEELLNDRSYAEIKLFSEDSNLALTLKNFCKNCQIQYSWINNSQKRKNYSLIKKIFYTMPYELQGIIFLIRHVILNWRLNKINPPNWYIGSMAVFFCSYFIHLDTKHCKEGRFYSRQWGLLPQLINDSGGFSNWLHHFMFSSVVPNLKTGINYVQSFNDDSTRNEYHLFYESYFSLGIIFKTLKKWIRLIIISWKLRKIYFLFKPQGSKISFWPHLKKDWLSSVKGTSSIQNCLWIELFDTALKNIPRQEKGFYLCENMGWERAFLHSWRKNGHGKIIGVPHASVPFWHLYYFDDPRTIVSEESLSQPLPDLIAVNGPVAWEAFLESGYSLEQLVEVEALRYLDLEVLPLRKKTNFVNSKSQHESDPHQINILVVGDYLPLSNHQLLCELEKTMVNIPDHYNLTFKPHPGLDIDFNNYPSLNIQKTTEALDSILGSYHLVISTNSTSASLDAFLAGIPVIIHLDGRSLNLNPLREKHGVSFVSDYNDFVKKIISCSTLGTSKTRQDFFWLDPHLPRWKRLINLN